MAADVGLGAPALDGEFGTGVSVAMGGRVTPLPASFAELMPLVEMGGGFLSRSPTVALGGGGRESVEGIPVVFVVGLLCALSTGESGPCVRKGMGESLLAGVEPGVLRPDSEPAAGLMRMSMRDRFVSFSTPPEVERPGLRGRFKVPAPGPEPVESAGEGPADPGPTFGLTTCWRPPTLTVGLPPD